MRFAAAVLAAVLAGCAAERPAERIDAAIFHAEPARPDPSLRIDADQVFPLTEPPSWWREETEAGVGTPFLRTADRRADGVTTISEGDARAMMIRATASGGREVMQVDRPADDSRTAFEPALLLCPSTLQCGAAVESTSPARVMRLSDGAERDHGTATRRMELRGQAVIRRPGAPEATAIEVHSVLETRLAHATARIDSTRWIVPGTGPVAERTEERVTVLGLFPRVRTRTVVRLPGPPANPATAPAEAP